MATTKPDFSDLKAVFINCSIKKDKNQSHTQRLINRAAAIMKREGVSVEHIYALDQQIAFGMIEDGREEGLEDDWPPLQQKNHGSGHIGNWYTNLARY